VTNNDAQRRLSRSRLAAAAAAAFLGVAACGGSASPSGGGASAGTSPATGAASNAPAASGAATGAITVGMVGNPQMKELEQLKGEFESTHPGITVNLLILPENEIRSKVTTDVSTGAATFDAVTIGMYEVPLFAKQGWIDELGSQLDADASYDSADFFKSVRDGLSYNGKLYAAPFYGESSTLFYRKDLLQAAGATISDKPTWDDVVAAAQKANNPSSGVSGICLRGLPGWGEMGAPLGTVINTFGGRWYDAGWNAQLTFPQTSEAIKFYVDTVKAVGEPGATQSGFTECETLMAQGKAAMWYDASSAADFLFDSKQNKKADQMGIAYAPTKVKSPSGWLWAWAFAIESTSKNKAAALEFVKWATSKDYYSLVNQKTGGWGGVPSGARKSLYDVAGYKDYAKAFGPVVVDSLNTVDPLHATNFPDTPYTGIQFVQIQEFQDLGTKCTQEFAAAITGSESTDDAIGKCQKLAEDVATSGGYK
jgi:sorbitol/mannitol transport system substrate-binding protein